MSIIYWPRSAWGHTEEELNQPYDDYEPSMLENRLDTYYTAAGCAEDCYPELINSDPHLAYLVNKFNSLNDIIAERLKYLTEKNNND